MRFDDRLATALGQSADSAPARQALWRQLVDLLAQSRDDDSYQRLAAFERLRAWRPEVPAIVRQSAALLLTARPVPPDLLRFFAEDSTPVSAPLLAAAHMAEADWGHVIPSLSPVARALLRHRRDLPPGAARALDLFASGDLIIEAPAAPPYQAPGAASEPPAFVIEDAFDFETGADGVIRWSDLAVRGALIGVSIAEPAPPGGWGVDGQAAGAFRTRSAFRNARLLIGGATPASGSWTIAGVPSFDPQTGRFTGYRGTGRRLQLGEQAEPVLGTEARDSLRQLSHELRTPLNAIAGFAEMIEREMLGPVPPPYRRRAAAILRDTSRIETVLDDLDEAAQSRGSSTAAAEPVDCALLLARLVSALGPAAARRGVPIALGIAPECQPALIDPVDAERMIKRLLDAAVGLAARGERIDIAVGPGEGARTETWIAVTRPALLASFDEARMLDACDVEGEDMAAAPPLGLGFTMRLVRSLAEAAGGRIAFGADRLRLCLPAAASSFGGSEDEVGHADAALRP